LPFGRRARALFVPAAAMMAGSVLFTFFAIEPLRRANREGNYNYSYHAIMHPLVVGLGVPQSQLSEREGITFGDPVGLELAQRIDPTVAFLDERYENVLWQYYRSLWLNDPGEMIRLYATKLATAGASFFDKTDARVTGDVGSFRGRIFRWAFVFSRHL